MNQKTADELADCLLDLSLCASPGWVHATLDKRGVRLIKIIYGKLPIEAFDQFVANWKSNGGDQITQEVNDWFKSVNEVRIGILEK